MNFKRYLILLVLAAIFLPSNLMADSAFAPPLPFRIGGSVTLDTTPLTTDTDTGFTFVVTPFMDFSNSYGQDTDGLNSSQWYVIDIPMYDATEQPNGAKPGDSGVIHVYQNGTELNVATPVDGIFTVGDNGGTLQVDVVVTSGPANEPPVADAGADQVVDAGVTVTLDGSASNDPDDGIATYQWTQTGGENAVLSDNSAVKPTFVAQNVSATNTNQDVKTFQLLVTDTLGLTDTATTTVTVNLKPSTFPEGVTPVDTYNGEEIGYSDLAGGNLTSVEAIDPATIATQTNRPDQLPYGLLDLRIKVNTPGGTVDIVFYLKEAAPADMTWFKHSATAGWIDFSDHVTFNADRTQMTVQFTDGGVGDEDGAANGYIVDPSGPGYNESGSSGGGSGGGSGCYIGTLGAE